MNQVHFCALPLRGSGWGFGPMGMPGIMQGFSGEVSNRIPMAVAGTLRNVGFSLPAPPGAGKTGTIVIYKNGSAAITLSITGASQTQDADTTTDVHFNEGDYLSAACTVQDLGTSPNCQITYEFEPDDASESVSGFSAPAADGTYTGALYGHNDGQIGWASTHLQAASLVAVAGSLTGYRIHVQTVPGVGTSRDFALYLNGVKQDGTGGTVDTTASIADTNADCTATFDLPVVAGDLVSIGITHVNAPNTGAAGVDQVSGSVAFSATAAGTANFGVSQYDVAPDSTPAFTWPFGLSDDTPSTTESDRAVRGNPATTLTLSGMRVWREPGDLGSVSITWTLRKNGADTALTLSLTSTNTIGVFTGSDQVEIASGDTFAIEVVTDGVVGGSQDEYKVVFVQGVIPTSARNLLYGYSHTVQGSDNFITGRTGTITGDQNALFALCDSAPSITGDKTFKVCADQIILEADSSFTTSLDLDGLSDVALTSPVTDGDVLTYDSGSGQWTNEPPSGGSLALDDLTDVAIGSPLSDGDVLKYDSGSGMWINEQGGAVSDLNDLSDVSLGSPVSDGDVLTYDSGTGQWTNEAPTGGGGLVLLEQHTASSSASLDFTSAITSTYDTYQIELVNLVPASDTQLLMLVSTDGGSTWANTNYKYGLRYVNDNGSVGVVNSTGTSSFHIFSSESSSSAGVVATLKMFSPLNASVGKHWTITGQSQNSDGFWYAWNGGLFYNSSSAVNAVQFKCASGNIASGTVRIYGVAK